VFDPSPSCPQLRVPNLGQVSPSTRDLRCQRLSLVTGITKLRDPCKFPICLHQTTWLSKERFVLLHFPVLYQWYLFIQFVNILKPSPLVLFPPHGYKPVWGNGKLRQTAKPTDYIHNFHQDLQGWVVLPTTPWHSGSGFPAKQDLDQRVNWSLIMTV